MLSKHSIPMLAWFFGPLFVPFIAFCIFFSWHYTMLQNLYFCSEAPKNSGRHAGCENSQS